jgi:hypothetical protein
MSWGVHARTLQIFPAVAMAEEQAITFNLGAIEHENVPGK